MMNLLKKWREYQDKRFLARLNRVLANNVLESDVVTRRNLFEGIPNPPLGKNGTYDPATRDIRYPTYTIDNDGKVIFDRFLLEDL